MHSSLQNHPPAAWFLVGATAVGKTAVAQYLAERAGAAILSVDAMLVYRGMDIGTAKPSPAERGAVRYYGIDLADPDEPFSTGAWLAKIRAQLTAAGATGSRECLPSIDMTNDLPLNGGRASARAGCPGETSLIAVGGTGLYVRALALGFDAPASDPVRRQYWQDRLESEGLDALRRELTARAPQAAAALADPENPRRVIRALEHVAAHGALPAAWREASTLSLIGLRLPRAALHARIAARVEQMFAAGLIDEVAALRARFPASWGTTHSHTSRGVGHVTARQAIGYAEVCDLLDNRLTREQAMAQIAIRTRQLAKRQETWFRHQADVTWIDIAPDAPVAEIATRVLAAWREHGPTPIRMS